MKGRTMLNELYELLMENVLPYYTHLLDAKRKHRDFRAGDVRHSQAFIAKPKQLLSYQPLFTLQQGLKVATPRYISELN